MMDNTRGFTLLELLIAAALISVLALFATQAYRASASDIRVADAKARAGLLTVAAKRYYKEYPNAPSFPLGSDNKLEAFTAPAAECKITLATPQTLVNCGFLEYRQVAYDNKNGTKRSGSVKMWFASAEEDNVEVCFQGQGRVLDKTIYCTRDGINFSQQPQE